jgi:hypothetical protein
LDTSRGRPIVHFHKGKVFKFSFSPDPAADGKVLGFCGELYQIFNKRKEHVSIIPRGGMGIKSTGYPIEKVTQITMRVLSGGHPNEVKHERKTAGNEEQ